MTHQEFFSYLRSLPWYKQIFFPQTILDFIVHSHTIQESEILELYKVTIGNSWFKPFYDWLFPELVAFVQQISQKQAKPTAQPQLAEDQRQEHEEHALINILICGILNEKSLSSHAALEAIYNINIVSKGFIAAVENKNKKWWFWRDPIEEFTGRYSRYRTLVKAEALNEAILILAQQYHTLSISPDDGPFPNSVSKIDYRLKRIFKDKELSRQLSLSTVFKFLQIILVSKTSYFDLIPDLLNFESRGNKKLSRQELELLYLQTISAGRINLLAHFDEAFIPFDDKRVIGALKDAAKNGEFEMVLHLIKKIPSTQRLDILHTKAAEKIEGIFIGFYEPRFFNIIQFSVRKKSHEHTQLILDALDKTDERMALITQDQNHYEHSPLIMAVRNVRKDHLRVLLNALSPEKVIDLILPHKITLNTPLSEGSSSNEALYEKHILPMLLNRLFGENQKLYAAYEYLKNCRWNFYTLRTWREHYLSNHFPSTWQNTIRFFSYSYTIPGHPLNKEELDVVVRAVLYRYYAMFDRSQRDKIEQRMIEKEPSPTTLAYRVK